MSLHECAAPVFPRRMHNTFISFNPHSTFSGGNPLCPRDSPWSKDRHMDICAESSPKGRAVP